MGVKVTRSDTVVERFDHVEVRRYLRREEPLGVGVGVSSFGPLAEGADPTALWEAHDVPETHYVLGGHGVIREESDETELAPGDVIVTLPGRRHVLWATGDGPLVTIYHAVAPR